MVVEKRTEHLKLSITIAAAIVVLCVFLFWPILKTVILAATVAVVIVPYQRWTSRKLWGENPRPWQEALTAGLYAVKAVVVVAILLALAVILVVNNFELLKKFVVEVATVIQGWLSDGLGAEIDLAKMVAESAQQLLGYVQSIFLTALDFFIKLVIFVLSLYFFLRHGGALIENIRQSLPEHHREVFNRFVKTSHSVLFAIYVIHVGTALLTFVVAVPFFWLAGFSDVFFWSLLCGVFQLIPVLGPSLIMFAIAAYAFATGDNTTQGILCLAVGYPVVALAPDIVFRSIMMSRQVKFSALLLLLGFVGGLVSMGAIGFIIGPFVLALLAESANFASERMREHNKAQPKG